MLVLALPPVGCYTVLLSCVVLVFGRLALQSFQFPALSFGPGCDYPSHKTCGLSVSVGQAEYCLNRNSCAALYPDVANRVFEVDEGLCVGCWTGWAMWLSCHGPPTGMKLIIIFLSWSIVEMQSVCVFFTLSARKLMNMQKKEESNYVSVEVVIHKPWVLWQGGDWLHWGLTCSTFPLNLSCFHIYTHTHSQRGS